MVAPTPVALVTGAGSGIGQAVALAFGQEGYSVVLAGRRLGALEDTARRGLRIGADMLAVPTDVRDPAAVASLFARTIEHWGRLDVLFNNAGHGAPSLPFEELPYQEWRSVVDTNLTGAFLCAQQAVRLMSRQDPIGGRIINNGSVSAYSPRPHSAAYTASKHALTGLTKSLSLDGRRYNIACGQIDIGNAATQFNEGMTRGLEQANGEVVVEPTIDVAQVARAVVYMASLPLEANVQFLTLMATKMPLIGRG